MIANKIFFKKKNKFSLQIFFISILFLIFLFFVYFFYFVKNEYFVVKFNNKPFYTIPFNKGGKKILNQDKKGLHLSYLNTNDIQYSNNKSLKYSIQLLTNDDYSFLKNKRDELINLQDSIFLIDELHIAVLTSNLGNNYFLLYKNFDTRELAQNYCEKYTFFTNKCLIVNVKNLE